MIHIIDRTLSCLDRVQIDEKKEISIKKFLNLLIETEVDAIEISEKIYNLLNPLPEYPYILRIKNCSDEAKYPQMKRFVCKNIYDLPENNNVCAEIVMNDIHELYLYARCGNFKSVRVRGLGDCMSGNFGNIFEQLRKMFRRHIEFSPSNKYYAATAAAAEWILSGGSDIVTTFSGFDEFAATEEIIMILKSERLRKINKSYAAFSEMRKVFSEITGCEIPSNKPVIGEKIFCVESGIHVDGITKQPKCYEPFSPESVGQTRTVIIGKKSGKMSVRLKCKELGISLNDSFLQEILAGIKSAAIKKNAALNDEEFSLIAERRKR